jgi:hypothetical protein
VPTFLIRLEAPVVYQAESLRRREVTELSVKSDTEALALSHVHRVTQGEVRVAGVDVVKP